MLNKNEYKFSDAIPLDEDGCTNDSCNGEYGYLVIYSISSEALKKKKYFKKISKRCIGGDINFTVDRNGEILDSECEVIQLSLSDDREWLEEESSRVINDISLIENLAEDFKEVYLNKEIDLEV